MNNCQTNHLFFLDINNYCYYTHYPQFTRKTNRRHKIYVLLRCFDFMYARYMSFLRALPGTNFMPFDSTTSNGDNFFIFKADEEGVLGVR